MILRRICQLSLTRITHQVSRAFDLKTLAAEKRRYSEADCECPMSALLDDRKIVISFIWTLKKREQFGGGELFFFLKSFEKTWKMFSTGYSFKRENEECRKF